MAERERKTAVMALALFLLMAVAALQPLYSYDFFWHLATGRWIAEHHALPLFDPFAVASDRTPWINGEWLFQLIVNAAWSIGGIALVAWGRAIVVAVIFAGGWYVVARKRSWFAAILFAAIAFAGGCNRLDARPGTLAALCVAAAIILISIQARATTVAYIALTIVWINTHPSALLAPLIAAAVALLARDRRDAWITAAASAIALLANPFGIAGVIAPLRLTAYVGSGEFVNAEWLPSPVTLFPLLYLCVAVGIAVFAFAPSRRDQLWRMAVFAALAYLAIAHVRNQGLFFAAFPLLVAPAVREEKDHRALALLAVVPLAWVLFAYAHRADIAPHRFPAASVARLKQTRFAGNIYNPDQFGGYLIWSFYPQRRTLTDGRNELYHEYIREYGKARVDSRAWHALLRKYRIDLAVDEYRGPIQSVDALTGQRREIPASLAYFPRRDWALIGYDDVSMVFARRAAFPKAAVDRWEIKGIVPDAKAPR